MNLLLDARKKLQQAQSAQGGDGDRSRIELSLEEHPNTEPTKPGSPPVGTPPNDRGRSAGKNLFSAKSSDATPARVGGINRNLLLALGGTVLLLAAGAGYWWYIDSTSDTRPLHPISTPPQPLLAQTTPTAVQVVDANNATTPGTTPDSPQHSANSAVPEIDETDDSAPADTAQLAAAKPASPSHELAKQNASVTAQQDQRVKLQHGSNSLFQERPQAELIDPLLRSAYLAYRDGKLDEAQQLYLSMFKKDAHNSDTLLGLAAIAQQRGDKQTAAQYYTRVLTLDPRNALANAGMSALSNDVDNNESRLKILLREQGNSAALHFALGNLYAEQARWGEAQQAYFNAYTLESESAEFAFNLAVSLDHLGQEKLAAQHYQRALQLDPSHSSGIDHRQISQRVQELTR